MLVLPGFMRPGAVVGSSAQGAPPPPLYPTTMYDGGPGTIPNTAQIIVYGPAWTPTDLAAYPNTIQIPLAHTYTSYATTWILDYESSYVFVPSEAVTWVEGRYSSTGGTYAEVRPTIYMYYGNLGGVHDPTSALNAAGYYQGNGFDFWIAHQTGTEFDYPGAVATQWYGADQGANYDISHIADQTWIAAMAAL